MTERTAPAGEWRMGMYYEEKWIDGNLMWRGTPNGEWKDVSRSELLTRLKKAESERDMYKLMTENPGGW